MVRVRSHRELLAADSNASGSCARGMEVTCEPCAYVVIVKPDGGDGGRFPLLEDAVVGRCVVRRRSTHTHSRVVCCVRRLLLSRHLTSATPSLPPLRAQGPRVRHSSATADGVAQALHAAAAKEQGARWRGRRASTVARCVLTHPCCGHARTQVVLQNLTTTNTSEVNNEPVMDVRTLANNDTIRIGNRVFKIEYSECARRVVDPSHVLRDML